MKKTLLFSLISLIFFNVTAQERDYFIELQNTKFDISNCDFYISKVIDQRNDTSSFGRIQKGPFYQKKNARIKGGVENSILNFIKNSIPPDNSLNEIILEIIDLKISEKKGFDYEMKEVFLKVNFCILKENNLIKVFQTESFINEITTSNSQSHEERIRQVLVKCIQKFALSSDKAFIKRKLSEKSNKIILKLDTSHSEDKQIFVSKIILNKGTPKYEFDNNSYYNLTHLKSLIYSFNDKKTQVQYNKFERIQRIANIFSGLGVGLISWEIGDAAFSGELKKGALFSGLGFTLIGFMIQRHANGKARKVVELFNSRIIYL